MTAPPRNPRDLAGTRAAGPDGTGIPRDFGTRTADDTGTELATAGARVEPIAAPRLKDMLP